MPSRAAGIGIPGARGSTHPTIPRASIVANVNTDMFLPLFPLKILMVLGLDESDLGQDIRATAKEFGLEVQADPEEAAKPSMSSCSKSDSPSTPSNRKLAWCGRRFTG